MMTGQFTIYWVWNRNVASNQSRAAHKHKWYYSLGKLSYEVLIEVVEIKDSVRKRGKYWRMSHLLGRRNWGGKGNHWLKWVINNRNIRIKRLVKIRGKENFKMIKVLERTQCYKYKSGDSICRWLQMIVNVDICRCQDEHHTDLISND